MSGIPEIPYYLIVLSENQEHRIDLGERPGWKEGLAQVLAEAKRFTFQPKPGVPAYFPPITVTLPEGAQWLYHTKTVGRMVRSKVVKKAIHLKLKIPAIGWERETLDPEGQAVTHRCLAFVYPNGLIELTDVEDPAFSEAFMDRIQAEVEARIEAEKGKVGS